MRVYDPTERREAILQDVLPALMADLDALKGPSPAPGTVQLFQTLAETLDGVDFVQENGPEDLPLKRRLLAEIEDHVGDAVIIASSSSALLVSDMQAECRLPHRIVLGHPFNPAHLMPLDWKTQLAECHLQLLPARLLHCTWISCSFLIAYWLSWQPVRLLQRRLPQRQLR